MKDSHPPQNPAKFTTNLRHYHRSGAQNPPTWDTWVDGSSKVRRKNRNWLKIAAVTIGVLILVGITVGLIIEMS